MEITSEDILIPSAIRNKINKMINTSKINITFMNGKKYMFNQTNLSIEKPISIIFTNEVSYIEVYYYIITDSFYTKSYKLLTFKRLINIVNNNL